MKTKETTPEVEKLKVELTVQEWEAVLMTLEQSTAPYVQVKSITTEFLKQLQPQIKKDEPEQ